MKMFSIFLVESLEELNKLINQKRVIHKKKELFLSQTESEDEPLALPVFQEKKKILFTVSILFKLIFSCREDRKFNVYEKHYEKS